MNTPAIHGTGFPERWPRGAWIAVVAPTLAATLVACGGGDTSAIKVVQGSYALKSTPDTHRPSTSLYPMGTFSQDPAYSEGSVDLDECNGRTGVTPEFPDGTCHDFATDSYPFLQRRVKGSVQGRLPPFFASLAASCDGMAGTRHS